MAFRLRTCVQSVNRLVVPRRHDSILASKAAQAVLKKDVKDVEDVPPLLPNSDVPASYRYIYPEFLATTDLTRRNKLLEKLVRQDMLRRRTVIDIPEFYPGSVMAVTTSDPNSPNKVSRFVGICICRGREGLWSFLILRNVVDGLGMEIQYNLYNPTIQKIEVLKLERRLDDQLFYLRDAPAVYSTFPFDMQATPHPQGVAVPLNDLVVKLNPMPWKTSWELYGFHGCSFELPRHREANLAKFLRPLAWEKYDLVKKYRTGIPLQDQEEMLKDVLMHNSELFAKRKRR